MEEQLCELLRLLNEKHPNERADGFVKILLYADGSGSIYDRPITEDGSELFSFDDPGELAEYLAKPSPEEPEHLEERNK